MTTRITSRRSFLAELGLAGSTGVLFPALGCAEQRDSRSALPQRSRVVVIHCPGVMKSAVQPHREQLQLMLQAGLARLSGTVDARTALGQWIRPVDTVGLKVNCLAGRQMSTHRELTEELIALMASAGLPRRQALVFDRSDADLRSAGYAIRTSGKDYRCLGNERAGYQKQLTVMPSGASRFSTIAAQRASVLINLPILKDHGIAGVSGALKNNFGLVHNPNKFHLNGCDPHVAEVNAQAPVRGKQRLVICDALRVQINGGPAYHPAGAQLYERILLATDPVALDVVAWGLLEALRKKRKLPTLAADRRKPIHIAGAARLGLGVMDRSKIQLIQVKVS